MKVLLIYNPVAGPRDVADDLAYVLSFLQEQGWEVTLRQTFGPGDATTYAREAAASGYDMVIAAGGDGTLGETATGLAHSDCILGVLPIGTGNVWAHMVGIPVWTPAQRNALQDAARLIVESQPHYIDLGKAGERYFVLWAGAGFDAQVAHNVEPHREVRRAFGQLSYVVTALVQALSLRGTRVSIEVDDVLHRRRALMIVVTNIPLYGQAWRLAPQAQLDDGELEVYIFKGSKTIDALRQFVLLVLGRHREDASVDVYSGRRIRVRAEKRLPLHLDGDPAGYTPLTVEVIPKALRVVIPSSANRSMFREGDFYGEESPSLAERLAAYWREERSRLQQEGERLRNDWERLLRINNDSEPGPKQ
jgi:diacylglycerol kinase (ATP)